MQRKIHKRTLRLAKDHLLWIGDQPYGGGVRILEDFVNASQFLEEIMDIREITVGRQFKRGDTIGNRTHGFKQGTLERKDMLHVPVQRGGHANETHGFSSGRCIEYDDVVAVLAAILVDVHHGAELFHARQNGQFFGFDVADSRRTQYRDDIGGDLLPVALDLFLNVQFENGQAGLNWKRIRGLDLE